MMKRFSLISKVLTIVVLGILIFWFFNFFKNKQNYNVNLSRQTVIKQIQSLNKLETSIFTIEKVIEVGKSGNAFDQFLYGDRILLIAHGQVIGGFDLSKLSEEDVEINGGTLKIQMPSPEILVSKLDNDETRVYDRQQGLLTKGDKELESTARLEAENVIRGAACTGGILQEAEKNGRNQLTSLFKSLGFETVIIEIPRGDC